MKKLLLIGFSLLTGISNLKAQCNEPTAAGPLAFCGGGASIPIEATATTSTLTYTIVMNDSWGDGWNGNEISISADGLLVLANATIASGASATETFTVPEGAVLTASWVTGSFTSEVSFNLLDENGAVVHSGAYNDAIEFTVPGETYILNWYDAPGGNNIGTGNTLDVVSFTPGTGSYSFFVTQTGVSCTESAAVEVVVDITDVNVEFLVQDISCIGNTDGTFAISAVLCGTPPFNFSVDGGAFGPPPTDLAAGSYSIIVEDGTGLQSSPTSIEIGTPTTTIPSPPTAEALVAYCSGAESILLEATASQGAVVYQLNMFDSWGDGWNGNTVTISVDGTVALSDATILTGDNATAFFVAQEGSTITAEWITGSFTNEVSFNIADADGNVVYSGAFNDAIGYNIPAGTYPLNWYDAATAGNLLGSGSPLEAIGTSLMPAADLGVYDFFVTQSNGGCESSAVPVTVEITEVTIELLSQDVSCIGNTDGTFNLGVVDCGTQPFSFSVDGGDFDTIPTNLGAGTYQIVVQDALGLQSSPVTIEIGTPLTTIPDAPSADSLVAYCSGSSSILLEAVGSPLGIPVTFTLDMFDSWGDGWNGNAITILADGIPVLEQATITGGSAGIALFDAPEGSTLTAVWTPGTFQNEVSFDLYDGNGVLVSSGVYNATIDYAIPATVFNTNNLNWYDAASEGNLEGTGSPLEAVGTGLMPEAVLGSYDFFVTETNEGCESSATQVTVEIVDVNVTLSITDESCTDYSNGTFAILDTLCGTAPFVFQVDSGAFDVAPNLTAGTYSIVVRDADSLFSAPIEITINTLETNIPQTASADSMIYACIGETSIELTASGDIISSDSLLTTMAGGNGGDGTMFVIEAVEETTIQDFALNMNPGTTGDVSIFYRADDYLTVPGSNLSDAGWILVGTAEGLASDGPDYTNIPVPVNITIPAGERYSFHIGSTGGIAYTNGTGLGNVFSSNASFNFIEGHGGAIFNCTFQPRVFNGLIRYEATESVDVAWFDAATDGNVIGNGTPLESIGTTILPDASAAGSYDFYVASDNNGCYSEETVSVTVNIAPVDVNLSSVDASCNTSADGSFTIDEVLCGEVSFTAPFTFSINGGPAGPTPTDLSAGVYEVIVFDGNGDSSATYFLTIGSADGPSDLVINELTDTSVNVSWVSNGSETGWTVEYGLAGFTPGAGEEIGSVTVTETVVFINSLSGNTNYDFYVVADCGTGINGDWGQISFTTDCGLYAVPFEETFEDDSDTRICWYNIYEVLQANWTYQTGAGAGLGGAALNSYEGTLNARFVSSPSGEVTKLASPRLDLSDQDSVALVFAYAQENWLGDQNTTKVYTRDSDTAAWVEIASYDADTPEWTVDTLFIVDTTNQLEIAFEGTNNWGRANVIDQIQVLPCSVEPGIDGGGNVCRTINTVDLNQYITAGEAYGYWSFPANETFVTGSIADIQFLPEGTYEFLYVVKTPCAADTTVATLVIYNPSSAGNDGADSVCLNEPYNLLSSLSGNIDLGGDWIDPQGNNLGTPEITASNIPGSYNYQYIASNEVCDADTSTVLLFVDGDCDYLGLMEADLSFFELYPNPTSGLFNIQANEAEGFFSVEVTDLNGRIIKMIKNYISGNEIKSVDLTNAETGTYFVKVYNNNVFKTFRVVKN